MVASLRLPLLIAGLVLANAAFAANEPERVIFKLPSDFELGFQQNHANQYIREYVPRGQKVTDWTQMITVLRQEGLMPARAYATKLLIAMQKVCPNATVGILQGSNDESSGYVTSCPKSPQTGRSELTLYQTMRGLKYMHTVQMAFSGKNARDVLYQPKTFMPSIRVCKEGQSDAVCRASLHSGSSVDWASFYTDNKAPPVQAIVTDKPVVQVKGHRGF